MESRTYNVYKYSELSEAGKAKALENLSDLNTDIEWWESTYEDAEQIGLKIIEFDIDRASYVKAEFIEDACHCAHKIKDNHGEICETYKTAVNFLAERDKIVNEANKDDNGDFEDEYELDQDLNYCEAEFLKSIQEDYRINLQKDFEYRTSDEAIIETIEANEYDFTEEGKLD